MKRISPEEIERQRETEKEFIEEINSIIAYLYEENNNIMPTCEEVSNHFQTPSRRLTTSGSDKVELLIEQFAKENISN